MCAVESVGPRDVTAEFRSAELFRVIQNLHLNMCHRRAMARFYLSECDRNKLTQFLEIKFENLVDELELQCTADEASAEVVARAARDVLSVYPQPSRNVDVEENSCEVEGLVLEFRDWIGCDARDRQNMLLVPGQFRKLLWHWGGQKIACKNVSLAALNRKVARYDSEGHSLPFVSQRKCILRGFKGWRMLCSGRGSWEMSMKYVLTRSLSIDRGK